MKRLIIMCAALFALYAAGAQTLNDGVKLIDAMRYDQARELFNKLLAAEPNNADIYYYLGDISRRVDDAITAKNNFNTGLEKSKDNALCNVGLGQLLLNENKPDEAKTLFNKALETSKRKNAKVLLYIGESLTQASGAGKDLAMAETLLNQALAIDKNNPDVYIALGDLYLEKEDPSLPVKNYELALTKDPKYAKSYLKKREFIFQSPNS